MGEKTEKAREMMGVTQASEGVVSFQGPVMAPGATISLTKPAYATEVMDRG